MAEVMKYEDFKEGGSEAAVKVSFPSLSSPFLHIYHFKCILHWEDVLDIKCI